MVNVKVKMEKCPVKNVGYLRRLRYVPVSRASILGFHFDRGNPPSLEKRGGGGFHQRGIPVDNFAPLLIYVCFLPTTDLIWKKKYILLFQT